MALPIILPAGAIAVYGDGIVANGDTRTPSGMILESGMRFGTVYNIWDGGATYVYGGDVVIWRDGSQLSRIVTQENHTYTILPARLVTIDNLEIAP